jgi:hypothetical protein
MVRMPLRHTSERRTRQQAEKAGNTKHGTVQTSRRPAPIHLKAYELPAFDAKYCERRP